MLTPEEQLIEAHRIQRQRLDAVEQRLDQLVELLKEIVAVQQTVVDRLNGEAVPGREAGE